MDTEETTVPSQTENDGLPTLSIVRVVLILLICVFGLLANLVVIFVILVLKEYKKSVTHWYVLQLALADSIFLLTLPFQASEELNDSWIFPIGMCKAKDSILFINYYASIIFLMVMSIDRYIAVCHNFSETLQQFRKQKSALIITTCVWIIAILFSIPIMLFSTTAGIEPHCRCTTEFPKTSNHTALCIEQGVPLNECQPNTETCLKNIDYGEPTSGINSEDYSYQMEGGSTMDYKNPSEYSGYENTTGGGNYIASECHYHEKPSGWGAFLAFNVSVMFILPFLVMSICYGLIMVKIYAANVHRTATTSSRKNSSRADNDRKRITIMCATLVITFTLCWLPFHAVHLAKLRGISTDNGQSCVIASLVSILLAYLNSALNPYLYSCLGSRFKQRMKSLKSVPAIKPLVAMTTINKKTKRNPKDLVESRSSGKSSGFSNDRSTVVTKAIVSRVSES